MRNAVPAQAEIQGQAAIYAPVVLNISCPRHVVPLPAILDSEFLIRAGITEVDVRYTGQIVRSSEQPGIGGVVAARQREARQSGGCKRNDVNDVAIIVKCHLI